MDEQGLAGFSAVQFVAETMRRIVCFGSKADIGVPYEHVASSAESRNNKPMIDAETLRSATEDDVAAALKGSYVEDMSGNVERAALLEFSNRIGEQND